MEQIINNIIIAICSYFILLNIITIYRVFKLDYYTKQQKFYQSLIIWLIPILGVFLVAFMLNDREEKKSSTLPKVPARILSLFALAFIINYNSSSDSDDTTSSDSFSSSGDSGGE